MKRLINLIFLTCFLSFNLTAQECDFRLPMDVPLDLAATFAELRANHFHGGLDMRTEQVIGKPVFSVEDGYVARISVSGSGYGNCLYIAHPCGITSVYGHLDSFEAKIDSVLKLKQYEQRRFNVDFELDETVLPVKRGEHIATSGNSGGSTGPHLHFEFRKTGTDYMIDPQDYYDISDNVRPRFHGFALSPKKGFGVVDNSADTRFYSVYALSNGNYRQRKDTIKAWGVLGVEVSANDYLPSSRFKFGLRRVEMRIDDKTCFVYDNDHYMMDSARYINAFIDYAHWYETRDMYMRCYMLPNSHRGLFSNLVNGGYVSINEEREYDFSIIVNDYKGNTSTLNFTVLGDSTIIPIVSAYNGGEYFPWDYLNTFSTADFSLMLPRKSLYEDCYFSYNAIQDSLAYSDIDVVGDELIPLENSLRLKIKVKNDTLPDKSKYYVAKQNRKKDGWYSIGSGKYDDGYISFKSSSFGSYKILCDTLPPSVYSPRRIDGGVSFKIYDGDSGIKSFEGKVDGKFAIFYMDNKNNLCYCHFDDKVVLKGGYHTVELTVEDNCGNIGRGETIVWW